MEIKVYIDGFMHDFLSDFSISIGGTDDVPEGTQVHVVDMTVGDAHTYAKVGKTFQYQSTSPYNEAV